MESWLLKEARYDPMEKPAAADTEATAVFVMWAPWPKMPDVVVLAVTCTALGDEHVALKVVGPVSQPGTAFTLLVLNPLRCALACASAVKNCVRVSPLGTGELRYAPESSAALSATDWVLASAA